MGCIKLKNIFGDHWKQSYLDLKISPKPTQSGGLAASTTHIAFPWDVGSGGIVSLVDISNFNRNPPVLKLMGHTGSILDMEFNSFNESVIASSSDDCTVKIWDTSNAVNNESNEARFTLTNHRLKVTNIRWNPCVDSALLTTSFDCLAKVWDVSTGQEFFSVGINEHPSSCSWTPSGDRLVVATKDSNVSLIDPRAGNLCEKFKAHDSNKLTCALWLGGCYGNDHILTTGFVNNKTRQLRIFDSRKTDKFLISNDIDSSPSPLIPHWDSNTGIVTIASRGDLTVRIFQYMDGELNRSGEFKATGSLKSFCMIPTEICDKAKYELARFVYNTDCKQINATSLHIIRRSSSSTMSDLYAETVDYKKYSFVDWASGNEKRTSCPSLFKKKCSDMVKDKDAGCKFREISKTIHECNVKFGSNFNSPELIPVLEQLRDSITDLIKTIKI